MENSNNKPKNLFLKFLPRAASAVSFQNPQFSPGRDHHHHHHSSKLKAHAHKGFSGPINYSVLPDEARGKPTKDGTYEAHEPTSPKVSCMGQIKYKHKKKKLRKLAKKNSINSKDDAFISKNKIVITKSEEVINKKTSLPSSSSSSSSTISKFFNRSQKKSKGTNPSSSSEEHGKNGRVAALDQHLQRHKKVPSLGQMNKFASGRESLANFDWTAQIAPLDHDRDYYSDDEERRRDHSSDDDGGDDDDGEVIIPYSAPIMLGGRSRSGDHDDDDHDVMGRFKLEPKKEVNLWKRRTMAPPPPLSLNSKVSS